MPQTVTMSGGPEGREPRLGDVVVSTDNESAYLVTQDAHSGEVRWTHLKTGESHRPGRFNDTVAGRRYWRILGPGERVTIET